ncbi:MAG TPA: PAS domain-containing sensor histidine kinase [Burkholderiales bacterium]
MRILPLPPRNGNGLSRESIGPPGLSSGRLLIVFGPVLALGVVTVLLALVAGLFGFYRHEMYAVAVTLGALVMLLAVILFYRQTAERRLSDTALHNVESRVRDLVDAAMDAIISTDDSQRIVLYNPAAARVFGWPREAVLHKPLDMLIPPRLRAAHHDHMLRFGETGTTSRRMGSQMVISGMRANGEEFPIEASISRHGESGRAICTVILRDVTERVRAEEALRRSREELRELSAAAHSVREEERRGVARELHDELGQALTALKMDVAWLGEQPAAGEPAVRERLAAMNEVLDSTVAATRRISSELRPLMLDDLGLIPAAEWLVQNFSERTGLDCAVSITEEDLDLREPHASTVFRILQESLTNIARHARAGRVEVKLERSAGAVSLSVRDDGRGFDPGEVRKNSYGLLGLRERAYMLGGEVRIDSSPGHGTTVHVRIPLEKELRPT